MSDHVYKKVELIGSSGVSIENAVEKALSSAGESIRNTRWLEVTEIRGHVVDAEIDHWQVGVKLGFTLESPDSPETMQEKKKQKQGEKDVEKALGGDALSN